MALHSIIRLAALNKVAHHTVTLADTATVCFGAAVAWYHTMATARDSG